MADMKAKAKKDGYDSFGADDHKIERQKGQGSWANDDDEGRGRRFATILKSLCCCWKVYPQQPLLPSDVVTHRKISRVVSTESLAKESLEVQERPTHTPTAQEKLHHARALNRLYSSTSTSSTALAKDRCHPSNGSLASYLESDKKQPPASRVSLRRLSSASSGSPRLERHSRPARPTHLPLKGTVTPTPSIGSTSSTPSTPRSRSGSWGVVRAGFSSLMRAVTPSPQPRDMPFSFPGSDVVEGQVCEEEEEEPEVECVVRTVKGDVHHPARECYGAVTINMLGSQGRWVRVGVCGLTGLPWVGGSGGLMVEVSLEPGGRSRWLALPNAHGPNVNVKMETSVKSPRDAKNKKKVLVKVSVWVCGRVWRHAAIGNALTPIPDPSLPVTLPLHHHTQLAENLGLVEVSLRCEYTYAADPSVGSSRGEITITLEVLRAKYLRPHQPGVLARATPTRLRDQVGVVCRAGLWVKGERTAKESSVPVRLPVTHDPVIRTRAVFTLQREAVQHAALILKVLYCSKWAGEDVVGRIQLGPLLYLGTCPDPNDQVTPPPDYNTSITLSHWGLALKTPGPTTMWHRLQL